MLTTLTDRIVLWVQASFEEGIAFFQKITTIDISTLQEKHLLYGLFLDPKGKIKFDAFFFVHEKILYVDCHRGVRAELIRHITILKIRQNIKLIESNLMVYSGETTIENLAFKDPRPGMGEVRVYTSEILKSSRSLESYHAHRIKNLVPDCGYEGKNKFPKQLNMYSLGAINMSKGCYIGQESVNFLSRMPDSKRLVAMMQDEAWPTSSVLSVKSFEGYVLGLEAIEQIEV